MDTTPETKKKEEEKKKAGFLANLVGKPSAGGASLPGLGGAAGSAGGFGGGLSGLGGLGGLFTGGGLLATKAGLMGLLIVGTAAAGGLGLLGYKLFGPGGADKIGSSYSLFSPRPAEEQRRIEAERAAADGSSASLDYLVKANAGSSQAPSDAQAAETVGDAPAAAASASAAPPSPQNAGVTGNKAAKLGESKFGAMSKIGVGGGGAGGSSASMSAAAPTAAPRSGGQLSAMGGAAPRGAAATRGLARKLGGRSAFAQLGRVRGDHRGATSSAGSGATYDGGIRGVGGGTAATAADPAPTVGDAGGQPNPAGMVNDNFPDPPAPSAQGWATPWQAAMNTAIMAVVAGAALLFFAGKLLKDNPDMTSTTRALAVGLMMMAALCGAVALKMGAQMAGGEFGQQKIGGMYQAAGAALMASSAFAMAGAFMQSPPAFLQWMMIACGAAALGAAAVALFSKPNQKPAWKFQNGRAPDWDYKDPESGEGGSGSLLGDGRRTDRFGWLKDQLV